MLIRTCEYSQRLIAHTCKKGALAAVRFKVMVLMLMIHYKLLLSFCASLVFGFCFVVQFLVSFLAQQSSRLERESWLLYFNCLRNVKWLIV